MIQVINGQIKQYSLPITGKLSTGETVCNYNLLDKEVLKQEGWLPLDENRPEYNPETEWLCPNGFEILEDKVIQHFVVEPLVKSEEEILRERLLTPIEAYEKLDIHVVSLDSLKEAKKKQLDYLCTQTIFGRFEVGINNKSYEFSFDTEAQLRFTGVAILFGNGQITEIEWTTYLNGERMRIPLTANEFNTVSQAALVHQNSNIVKYNNLLKEVDRCETNEEVDAINW